MASPIQLAAGKFKLRTDLPADPVTGRRRQVAKIFYGSKTQAKLAQAAFEVEHKGADHSGTDVLCGELFDRWLVHVESRIERQTLDSYRQSVELYLRPHIGHLAVKDVKPSHFDELYRYLKLQGGRNHRGLASTTIKRVHGHARAAFVQAERWEWIGRNPVKLAQPPAAKRKKPAPPDTASVIRLLGILEREDPDVHVFVECLASLGARPGEVCGLRWSDIDWSSGVVTVDESITRYREAKSTKSDRERQVMVDDELLSLLKRFMPAGAQLEHFVFGGQMPWGPTRATQTVLRIRLAHGLPSITPRSLRHYVATRLIANGVDVRTVSERLGHANAATTLGVYSSWVPENDRTAADLLRALRDAEATT